MAKRTISKQNKKVVINKKHPRTSLRGWFVLRGRWISLFKDFGALTQDTFTFSANAFGEFIIPQKRRTAWNKRVSAWEKNGLRSYNKIKKSRWLKKPMLQKYQGALLMLVGIIAINIFLDHWWDKQAAERMNRAADLQNQLAEVKVEDKPHPTHIFIQWFVDAPVEDGTLTGDNWTLSETKAVYLTQSARPAVAGNIIIYGHNTRSLMGNIRALKGYEKIKLTLSDGSQRWYQVTEMHQVTPETVTYIQPTETEVLTLFTCAGFADKERFVVRAEPIDIN